MKVKETAREKNSNFCIQDKLKDLHSLLLPLQFVEQENQSMTFILSNQII
jgi:hypothetical protein